jgi:NTE family protein
VAASACAGRPAAPEVAAAPGAAPAPAAPGAPEQYGPPTPPPAEEAYGPRPLAVRPLVLVLGPGLARSFAGAGAIRALVDAKIPIGAVVASEGGALVGALFALGGKLSQMEWGLLRFNEEVFTEQGGIMAGLFEKGAREPRRLEDELGRIFAGKDIAGTKLPLRISVLMKDTDRPVVLDRGPLAPALRAALAAPGLYTPGRWEEQPALSAGQARPYAVADARSLGIGPVVVIDTVGPGAPELRDADLVIQPELKGIGPTDFGKRSEAAFRGRRAVAARLNELKRLAGMLPPEGAQP